MPLDAQGDETVSELFFESEIFEGVETTGLVGLTSFLLILCEAGFSLKLLTPPTLCLGTVDEEPLCISELVAEFTEADKELLPRTLWPDKSG